MASDMSAPFLLLALPDPCLLAVLQCLAVEDQRSLFSAARSHSRLHHAAVAALNSITVFDVTEQQQMDTVLLYLAKHGQHVDSISLSGPLFEDPPEPRRVPEQSTVSIRHLPSSRQLSSLQLHELHLQLQPGHGFQGVLGAAEGIAALKKLEISSCQLLDEAASQALAAALSQLPAGLEHFSMSGLTNGKSWVSFPTGELQRLQQLTYLELAHGKLQGSGQGQLALQPLQALTRLVDLRLAPIKNDAPTVLSASMLSGAHNLTRLQVFGNYGIDEVVVDPAVLAGKTQLQHLQLAFAGFTSGAAGVAQLLSHLQPLQQLTHLDLTDSLSNVGQGNPPAAAYSALTASSKLQHLDISYCTLPAGVFRHVFPAGRQLPHLRSLDLHWVKQAGASWDGIPALAPEGSRLVSCCPGLQLLNVANLQYSAELLASLHGLSQLHTLRCRGSSPVLLTGLQKLCQLTGLRELSVALALNAAEEVLPLTELKQLTSLALQGVPGDSNLRPTIFRQHDPFEEPVWRQVLQHYSDVDDAAVYDDDDSDDDNDDDSDDDNDDDDAD